MFLLIALFAFAFGDGDTADNETVAETKVIEEQPKSTRRPQRRGGKPKPGQVEVEADDGKCHSTKCSKNEL